MPPRFHSGGVAVFLLVTRRGGLWFDPGTAMNTPDSAHYLKHVRRTSAYAGLRLLIDVVAGLAVVVVLASVIALIRQVAWAGLLQVYTLVAVFIGRGLALALLDIADVQLRQSLRREMPKPE